MKTEQFGVLGMKCFFELSLSLSVRDKFCFCAAKQTTLVIIATVQFNKYCTLINLSDTRDIILIIFAFSDS